MGVGRWVWNPMGWVLAEFKTEKNKVYRFFFSLDLSLPLFLSLILQPWANQDRISRTWWTPPIVSTEKRNKLDGNAWWWKGVNDDDDGWLNLAILDGQSLPKKSNDSTRGLWSWTKTTQARLIRTNSSPSPRSPTILWAHAWSPSLMKMAVATWTSTNLSKDLVLLVLVETSVKSWNVSIE